MNMLVDANNYYLNKDYNKAIEFYTQLIELEDNYKYYTNRSMAYFHLKKYSESLRDSTKAIRLNPKNSRLWGRLGASLNKIKKYNESLTAYEKAIKLCDNDDEKKIYLNMIEYINFKDMYQNMGLSNGFINNIFNNMTNYITNNPTIINKIMDNKLQEQLTTNPMSLLQDKELMNMFNNIMFKL